MTSATSFAASVRVSPRAHARAIVEGRRDAASAGPRVRVPCPASCICSFSAMQTWRGRVRIGLSIVAAGGALSVDQLRGRDPARAVAARAAIVTSPIRLAPLRSCLPPLRASIGRFSSRVGRRGDRAPPLAVSVESGAADRRCGVARHIDGAAGNLGSSRSGDAATRPSRALPWERSPRAVRPADGSCGRRLADARPCGRAFGTVAVWTLR